MALSSPWPFLSFAQYQARVRSRYTSSLTRAPPVSSHSPTSLEAQLSKDLLPHGSGHFSSPGEGLSFLLRGGSTDARKVVYSRPQVLPTTPLTMPSPMGHISTMFLKKKRREEKRMLWSLPHFLFWELRRLWGKSQPESKSAGSRGQAGIRSNSCWQRSQECHSDQLLPSSCFFSPAFWRSQC